MKKQSIAFTEPQAEWLAAESQALGIPVGELVRRVIDSGRGISNARLTLAGAEPLLSEPRLFVANMRRDNSEIVGVQASVELISIQESGRARTFSSVTLEGGNELSSAFNDPRECDYEVIVRKIPKVKP